MKRLAALIMACALVGVAPSAWAGAKEALVGTWKLVVHQFGPTYPLGPDAVGLLIYDASGYMSLQIMRANRPKIRGWSGDAGPETATPEEAEAVYKGYRAYFGTYQVDEAARSITHRIEGNLSPNLVGVEHVELFKLSGDVLTFEAWPWRYVWKRVK